MAMDKDRLGDAIRAAVDAVTLAETGETPASSQFRIDMFRAMAEAIIGEITGYAEVATNVAVASVTGVTTGTGTSGTGTGSGTGTIS